MPAALTAAALPILPGLRIRLSAGCLSTSRLPVR
ncbi:hypothetical protein JOF56_008595 [Kibdelosporangium banguiense]|uniref:Uncharacterized protein n=1 Tax=Kibdelosporangium banguiense TaxID=1365924 RepID=A0ABS4TUY1_9PSEU|nr:hypothetical protein [Kibdelosporangium banguiense]